MVGSRHRKAPASALRAADDRADDELLHTFGIATIDDRAPAVEGVPQMTDDPHDAMMLPYTARPRSTKAATPSPWPALVGAVVMLGLLTLVL